MRAGIAVLSVLLAAGCSKKDDPAARDLGEQTADIAADTQTLKIASAAVNELVRNAADCDAARPLIAETNAKLDEVAGRVRTVTGRTTLDSLRAQVKRVAEACP